VQQIEAIASQLYGADGIDLQMQAQKDLEGIEKLGLGKAMVCMAKTHLSLSHDATLLNAPTGFTVTVRDLRPYTGAGWIVALCGDMQTMPGLGTSPAAFSIDIDADGNVTGLF
jgi:formate--tetrahydrofolate ligase